MAITHKSESTNVEYKIASININLIKVPNKKELFTEEIINFIKEITQITDTIYIDIIGYNRDTLRELTIKLRDLNYFVNNTYHKLVITKK